nr:uncharacterized protein LOC110356599 isoform X2 [Columba livia]
MVLSGTLEGAQQKSTARGQRRAAMRAQRAELREAVWEQVELLQKKLQRLRERWERVQEPTALSPWCPEQREGGAGKRCRAGAAARAGGRAAGGAAGVEVAPRHCGAEVGCWGCQGCSPGRAMPVPVLPGHEALRAICPLLCLTPPPAPRRLLVFLALLQVAVLTLVLLQGDVPNGSVLAAPPGAAQRAPGSSSKTQLERE